MLMRACLAIALMSLLSAGAAQAQQFYSGDRTGSSKFTTVSFGTANQEEKAAEVSESVVDLQVADGSRYHRRIA